MVQGEGCGSQQQQGAWTSLDQSADSKRAGFMALQMKAEHQRKNSSSNNKSSSGSGGGGSSSTSWITSKNTSWGSREVDQFKKMHNY